jgi:GNAT superfamily N-acetyltransferase
LLRQVEIQSKAHWGYSDHYMSRFASVISMSPAYIEQHEVWVVERAGEIMGFYGLIHDGETSELDHMWLLPQHIGKGHGRRLFEHAVKRACVAGATRLEWQAERHAVGFYERMGARHLRWTVSPLGRRASVMGVQLVPVDRLPC